MTEFLSSLLINRRQQWVQGRSRANLLTQTYLVYHFLRLKQSEDLSADESQLSTSLIKVTATKALITSDTNEDCRIRKTLASIAKLPPVTLNKAKSKGYSNLFQENDCGLLMISVIILTPSKNSWTVKNCIKIDTRILLAFKEALPIQILSKKPPQGFLLAL